MYFKLIPMLGIIIKQAATGSRQVALYSFCVLLLTACSKHSEPVIPQDAGLAFYNASQVLRQELVKTGGSARILLNVEDPHYAYDSVTGNNGVYMPDFRASNPDNDAQQIYPVSYVTPVTPAWMTYMRVYPGTQKVAFLAPDSSILIQTGIDTRAGENTSLYLTDSLGYYQAFHTTDDSHPAHDQVQLKLIHLGPDAGLLVCTVNNTVLDGGKTFVYRTDGGWNNFPAPDVTAQVLLKVRVSPASDTTMVIGSTTINATPGHSYSLILNGYYYDQHYLDPGRGKRMDIIPDFRLSVIKNK